MADDGAITIETDRFEHRKVGDHFINPCCFGEDLAAWLKDRLAAAPDLDLEIGAPIQEDYGWGLKARGGADRYWIAISFIGDGPQEEPGQWRVAADWTPGLLRRLTGKPAQLAALRAAVRQALVSEPGVQILE
jgi:hypothetical protein